MNKEIIKVSIVIPNRNCQDFVGRAIESAIAQTYKNIEIICIDDASTDESRSIIESYSAKDNRIQTLFYDENKSQSQARKDGVALSTGDYLLFLDSDDELNEHACEELVNIAQGNPDIDIICFDTKVILTNPKINKGRALSLEKWLNSSQKNIYNRFEIFEACFVKKELPFTLWNKLYKTTVAKLGMKKVSDGFYPKGQDAYAFFLIATESKSLLKIHNIYYSYYFGNGIAGSSSLSIPQFEKICSQGKIINELKKIKESSCGKIAYGAYIDALEQAYANECVGEWETLLKSSDMAKGYEILNENFDSSVIIKTLITKFTYRQGEIAKLLYSPRAIKNEKSKSIGLFYHRLSFGGVQRVIKNQINSFCNKGFDVNVFIEEDFNADDSFSINKKAKIIQIEKSVPYNKENALKHLMSFENALIKNPVDIIIYHAGSSANLLWDLLLFKRLQIRSVVVHHECFAQYLSTMTNYGFDRHCVFKLADNLVTLTKSANLYFNAFGVNSLFIPNKIELEVPAKSVPYEERSCDILCIGRLDDAIKQYPESAKIISLIKKEVPNVKCTFVGNFKNKTNEGTFLNFCKKLNILNNVEFAGAQKDVSPFFLKAKCLLITSQSEGFSLVLAEAKGYGTPIVMYELPYLDLARDKLGLISVDQGSVRSAAESILKIITDKEYWNKLSKEAIASYVQFNKNDVDDLWVDLIEGNQRANSFNIGIDDVGSIVKAVTSNYLNAVKKYKQLEISLKEEKLKKSPGLAFIQNIKNKTDEHSKLRKLISSIISHFR